jgi:methyl-accepting chemotaxis protein
MTIGKKITFGFGTTVAIAAALGIFAYSRFTTVDKSVQTVTGDVLPSIQSIQQLDADMYEWRGAVCLRSLVTDPQQAAAFDREIDDMKARVVKETDDYAALLSTDEKAQDFETFKQLRANYVPARDQLLALARAGKSKELADYYTTTAAPLYNAVTAQIEKMVQYNQQAASDASQAATDSVNAGQHGVELGLGLAVIVAAAIGTLIVLGTKRSLSKLADTLSGGAEQVASASSQVSSASQSLAQGASESAASLEETSSSLEEISSMTKKNADTAHQASVLSTEAKAVSERGNTAMSKMSAAISSIEKSALETAKIVKTIDEIAFQTNLLALNAAVEAARAGEAGKGFAVVAEEVRNLAMRSAEAAKNTASLIEGSVQNAKNGVVIAEEVVHTLVDITASGGKVNQLVAEIAAASQEQSQGINQVNQAIQQMDKVTQGNAAAAEESAASSEELNSQSEQLRTAVGELLQLVRGATAGDAPVVKVRPSVQHAVRTSKPKATLKSKAVAAKSQIPFDDDPKSSGDFSDFNVAA